MLFRLEKMSCIPSSPFFFFPFVYNNIVTFELNNLTAISQIPDFNVFIFVSLVLYICSPSYFPLAFVTFSFSLFFSFVLFLSASFTESKKKNKAEKIFLGIFLFFFPLRFRCVWDIPCLRQT